MLAVAAWHLFHSYFVDESHDSIDWVHTGWFAADVPHHKAWGGDVVLGGGGHAGSEAG